MYILNLNVMKTVLSFFDKTYLYCCYLSVYSLVVLDEWGNHSVVKCNEFDL